MDKVGNEWCPSENETISYTIYIDRTAPTAEYISTETAGSKNVTQEGNFYNEVIEYTFKVFDSSSGVQSATLCIDNAKFKGTIDNDNENYKFKVPVGSLGDAKLILADNLDNIIEIELKNIKNSNGEDVFLSNYILIENDIVKEPIYKIPQPNKGNWHKSELKMTIGVSDKIDEKVSSGLAEVKISINNKEYTQKVYDNSNILNDTFDLFISDEWIDKAISDDGAYEIELEVMDNSGNRTMYSKKIYIDNVAPVISDLTGVVDGSINTGIVTVDVKVAEKHYAETGNNTTITVTRTHDGETVTYEAQPFMYTGETTTKPYTFTEDGFYTVLVTAEDAAGNKAESKTISFRIDNSEPLAEIRGVIENEFYQDKKDVTINVIESYFEDMDVAIGITVELNGETRTIDNVQFSGTQKNSTHTYTFTEEGKYTIKVDAIDAAKNVAITKTVMFTIDTSEPTIRISGVSDGNAYKGDVIPVITIFDNYYKNHSIKLVKTGVYFNEQLSDVDSVLGVDVTDSFISSLSEVKNGVEGTFDTFEKLQGNDGIYTLTVMATDYAGKISKKIVHFSVNRFGSVYEFDDNLKSIINTYNSRIDTDFKITEYNADRLVSDSVKIRITRDGAALENIKVDRSPINNDNVTGESGWYQYEYIISKDNFKLDGVYVITVSSADEAGNKSENITYDELNIRFVVDTTKPDVIKVNGLSKSVYDVDKQLVDYEVFDAVGIKLINVYVDDECIQTISSFDDITSYTGSFTIYTGKDQHIRFVVEDMAGNIIDSDNAEDIKLGKIVYFNDTVTISTDAFVLWYANKPLFYGTIVATTVAVIGGTAIIVLRRRKLRLKNKK